MSGRNYILSHPYLVREITGYMLAVLVLVLAYVGVIRLRGALVIALCFVVYVLNHLVWLGLREFFAHRASATARLSEIGPVAGPAENVSVAGSATSTVATLTRRRGMVVDHRQQQRAVQHGWDESDLFAELPADVALRVRRAGNRGYFGPYKWRAMVMLLVALAVGVSIASGWLTSLLGPHWFSGWRSLLMPVGVAVLLYGTINGTILYERTQRRRRLAAALLAERHCLCCLYSLSGLKRQDDGCVDCPECGAAWRMGD